MIEIRDLTVRIGGQLIVSLPRLDVAAGQCVALVGESGSGKTTTLLAALGLLRDAQVSGSIRIGGVEVIAASEQELRGIRGSIAALIMQSPSQALNPTLRLGTFMKRVLARHGIKGAEAASRAEDAVTAVLLSTDILRRYPHQVSGGQAQRFAIALALALGANAILADEPTSALDVTVQAEVVAVLRRLRDERGLAMLLVSHDLALVSTIADHVVVLKDGQVVESGTADAIFTGPAAQYTRELIAAVPTLPGGGP